MLLLQGLKLATRGALEFQALSLQDGLGFYFFDAGAAITRVNRFSFL